jgi:hypothetical protein
MLDLRGFVSPEQNFGGLYKVSQNLRQETAQNEAEQRRLQAGKVASSKFLVDYLDQEQFLTGTPQDPYTVKKVSDLLKEGSALIEQGVDNNQLLMALSPKVGRLSQETQVLKQLDAQKKKAGEMLKANPAIDINKLNNAFDEIYFETDEMGGRRLKDISKLDPSKDYVTEILNTKPVFTPAAVDDYFKSSKPQSISADVMVTDKRGGYRKAALKFDTPTFMQPNIDPKTGKLDEDNAFVPKFQIAKDGDQEIVANFLTKKGEVVEDKLRLLDENHFFQMMKNPNVNRYFMQQAREFADSEGIPMNDPRVDVFTRAIAYDYADNSPLTKGTYSEKEATKAAPETKVSVTVNNKTDKGEVAYNDMYGTIDDYVTSTQGNGAAGVAFTGLPLDAQNVVMEFVNKGKTGDEKKTESDIYLRKEGGKIFIMDASKEKTPQRGQKPPSDAYLGELPRGATNVKTTQGVKGKVAAEQAGKGGSKPATTQKPQTLAERMKAAAGKK